ncbi:BLUF domain-containing protein [Mesorhizobium sp. NBSH29]|uniref:BLUF domain-containing protein n=1 Tax=Mesorhizobium sp. NBSH29 TaxID=2654249 RepID=UPI001896736F|nr:BLUF domain-containing protein [Mesorhizobium sp. NBSH29]
MIRNLRSLPNWCAAKGTTLPDIRLTYVSTLRPVVAETDIRDLVAKAAEFNSAHGITGVLAVDGNRVCQILEGPETVVSALFKSIQHDQRHHTVVMLERRGIEKSGFESWGMVRQKMIDIVQHALTS